MSADFLANIGKDKCKECKYKKFYNTYMNKAPNLPRPSIKPDPLEPISPKRKLSELKMKIYNMNKFSSSERVPAIVDYLNKNFSKRYPEVVKWFFDDIFGVETVILLEDSKSNIQGISILSSRKIKIASFFISKEYRGIGAGRMLLLSSIRTLCITGINTSVTIKTDEPAMVSFLHHMGWRDREPNEFYFEK